MLNVFQRTQEMTSGTSHDQAHAWRYCQNSFQNYPSATKSVQNTHEINETSFTPNQSIRHKSS